jgi:hypothetical protein
MMLVRAWRLPWRSFWMGVALVESIALLGLACYSMLAQS